MRTFDVFNHPIRGYEAVKKGFSWPAFFFTWIWAFIKKIWGWGVAFLGAMIVLGLLQISFEEQESLSGLILTLLLHIGITIYFGVRGNDWRRENLAKRGYEHLQTVEASTPDAAIASVLQPPT